MPFDPLPIAHPDTADPDAEVLLRAAEIIEKLGHNARATAVGPEGEVCIGCAIARSYVISNPDGGSGWAYVMEIAPRLGFKGAREMFRWNMEPGRTKGQVLDRLRFGDRGTAGR